MGILQQDHRDLGCSQIPLGSDLNQGDIPWGKRQTERSDYFATIETKHIPLQCFI